MCYICGCKNLTDCFGKTRAHDIETYAKTDLYFPKCQLKLMYEVLIALANVVP
jgi:hypothetical protein